MFAFISRKAALARMLAVLIALGLQAGTAHAQLARTFVSAASGNDANDCNRLTPCRTFQAAHDKTFDQGEVTVLDPGGYGAVTITKSISIVNDGVGEAGISVSGVGTGIVIEAPAGASVNLRGLSVQGIGFGGGRGLSFRSGSALTITRCVFRNLTENGIDFRADRDVNLSISNTLVADSGRRGIMVMNKGPNAAVQATLHRVHVLNSPFEGLWVHGRDATGGKLNVTVSESTFAANGSGVLVQSQPGAAQTSVTVVRSVIANNSSFGVDVEPAPTTSLQIGQSIIVANERVQSGSTSLHSFGDNIIAGNANGDPALPLISKK